MRILIVEDDEALRLGLTQLLTGAGYRCECAASLAEAREKRGAGAFFHLILIDIMLSDGSGLSLCREIRKCEDTPILFITALDDEDTVIEGLSAGADDYVTKPFRAGELLARIEANLRRQVSETYSIESGDVIYRFPDERVYIGGSERNLRRGERALLKLLLQSGGRLLRREYILYALWDSEENYVEENTLSVQVSRLRKELGRCGAEEYIETIRGVGYRWKLPCVVKAAEWSK